MGEQPQLDLAALAELAGYLEVVASDWRLAELADYQADFYRHAGHDPDAVRLGVYEETGTPSTSCYRRACHFRVSIGLPTATA